MLLDPEPVPPAERADDEELDDDEAGDREQDRLDGEAQAAATSRRRSTSRRMPTIASR